MNTIKLTLIGCISGLISYYLTLNSSSMFGIYFIAGLVFGLFIALYFSIFYRKISWGLFIWIIISTFSYFLAVFITLYVFEPLNDNVYLQIFPGIPFMVGGLIGSFFMLLGFSRFVFSISLTSLIILSLLGGLLGLSWYAIPDNSLFVSSSYLDWGPPEESFFGLFVIWQTVMAGTLGFVVDRKI